MIGAGQMRERVTIQQENETSDGGGGYSVAWIDVASVAAQVRPLRGKEQLEHMQMQDSTLFTVTIRYRSDVTPKMRLDWIGTILNIRAVINPDQRRRFLEITCEAGVAV